MEQIIVTKPNGDTYPLAVRSTATRIAVAEQNWALLDEDTIRATVESPFPQTYGIGDKIMVFGRLYKLNKLPKVIKNGMHDYIYDLVFEGVSYDLLRVTYDLTIDTTNNQLQDVQAETLTGDLARFATVLIANANRVFPGVWVLGDCPDTIEDKTLVFNESDNCLSVMHTLCDEFKVEYEIVQEAGMNTVNFKQSVGHAFPYTFKFGRGKGLYHLVRQNVDSSNIVTRLKVFGSTSNITSKYRANRLCLPLKSKAQSYIEKAEAVNRYGIHEATKYFDDIKPTFNGVVSSVDADSVLKFTDVNMFDLNAVDENDNTIYLILGCSAKVHFNTGNLAGYEFEVHAYDHGTHTITLKKEVDDRGDEFPSPSSAAFQFAVGDKYKILDVAMPQEFEDAAESELAEQGDAYYDQNCQPKVQYGLSIFKKFLENYVGNGTTVNIFKPGDLIPIQDSDIDVDKSIRVQSLVRNLLDEYDYSLTIADTVSVKITNRIISDLIENDKIHVINNLKDPARARMNWRSSREVMNMVFDPDGDYYTEKIKPNSIDTLALSIGAKSMQFGLIGTVFQPNYQGNKNVIKVKGGVLTHYTINPESAQSWVLADNTTTFANDSDAFYIYAKCSRSTTSGEIIFSTAQIKVEQDANYYHFWIGIVNSVDSDLHVRSIALSYGFTMVNGRFIKTGRIESADGTTYFDLDNSEIGGRIVFTSNGEEKTLEELGEESLASKNYINNTLPSILEDIQGDFDDLILQIDGKIESWFQTSNPATAWTTDNLKAKHVGDMWYNSTEKSLKRYSSTYDWVVIEDKTALDAYETASLALDTADGKRRVFVTTPTTPYDIGDLWVDGTDLRRCSTAKTEYQQYNVNDWVVCVAYDNTKTVIDGGLVTSGTIQVAGSNTSILAGMTGQGTAAASVRFWAGASFENRTTAPFRVKQDGSFVATMAEIEGIIRSISGSIGGWTLGDGYISSEKMIGGVPAVRINSENGQIILANGMTIDADGLRLLYENRPNESHSRVRIMKTSVGSYDDNLLLTTGTINKTTQYQESSTYIYTINTFVAINPTFLDVTIGFLERDSVIHLDYFKVSFVVPYMNNNNPLTLSTKAPNLDLVLYRDDTPINTFYSNTSSANKTSGNIVEWDFTPNLSINVNSDDKVGTYHFIIRPHSSNSIGFISSTTSGVANPFTVSLLQRYNFTKGNNQHTIIGFDGLVSAWESGFFIFNGKAFAVRVGSNMLRLTEDGLKKSVDVGVTWTSL